MGMEAGSTGLRERISLLIIPAIFSPAVYKVRGEIAIAGGHGAFFSAWE